MNVRLGKNKKVTLQRVSGEPQVVFYIYGEVQGKWGGSREAISVFLECKILERSDCWSCSSPVPRCLKEKCVVHIY